MIDGVSYELKPGESRTHAITAKSQITYNRGGTLGNATYQLTAGTYRFSIQIAAWQVNKTSFSVVVDNSANGCDFHCEIDGQPRTIAPHKTLQLTECLSDRRSGSTGAMARPRRRRSWATTARSPSASRRARWPSTCSRARARSSPSVPRRRRADGLAGAPRGERAPPKRGRESLLPTLEDLEWTRGLLAAMRSSMMTVPLLLGLLSAAPAPAPEAAGLLRDRGRGRRDRPRRAAGRAADGQRHPARHRQQRRGGASTSRG